MAFKWFGGWKKNEPESVHDLLARKEYDRAVELLRADLAARPLDRRVRLQLGEALILAKRHEEAADLLKKLADELRVAGFGSQALVVLKKIQAFAPERADVREAIARLSGAREERLPELDIKGRPLGAREDEFTPPPGAMTPPVEAAPAPEPQPDPPPAPAVVAAEDDVVDIVVEREDPDPVPADERRLLAVLPDEERQRLLDRLPLHVFGPGEILLSEGAAGESVFVLLRGRVRVYVKNKAGVDVALRELGEGETFGVIARANGRKRAATVTAAEPCEVVELDPRALDALFAAHPPAREVFERVYEEQAHDPREGELRGKKPRRVHLRKPPKVPRKKPGKAPVALSA